MSSVLPKVDLSFDEYLQAETKRSQRHELVDGRTWAMVGTTLNHNSIAGNLYSALKASAKADCSIFFSDVKVRVGENAFYPDVLASCVPSDGTALYVSEPCVLAEVSSPSTETYDRTLKLKQYRRIKSLESYLLVSSSMIAVELYQRANDVWTLQTLSAGESIELPCLGFTLSVDAIYQGLSLPTLDEAIAAQRAQARERDRE
jgi:Uma2 family endonuclease